MIDCHRQRSAHVEAIPVPPSKATSFGVIDTDRDGRIRGFLEKPENLPSIPSDSNQTYGFMGNYLFDMGVLLTALHEAKERGENEFGCHFLLRFIYSHRVCVYNFSDNRIPWIYRYEEQSYWCDAGDINTFYAVHHDVMGGESSFNLLNPQWFINSSNYQGPSLHILSGDIQDSVIGAGLLAKCARIHNTVFSQGAPMLVAGDEIGRTQKGNNNAYCQDNEISWVNWDPSSTDREFLAFVQHLISLWRAHPVFRRNNFLQGRSIRGSSIKDILWLKPDGTEMNDEEWVHDFARCLGMYLDGEAMEERDQRGNPILDDNLLLLFNGHHEAIFFHLPELYEGSQWLSLLDFNLAGGLEADGYFQGGDTYTIEGRSLALLVQRSYT